MATAITAVFGATASQYVDVLGQMKAEQDATMLALQRAVAETAAQNIAAENSALAAIVDSNAKRRAVEATTLAESVATAEKRKASDAAASDAKKVSLSNELVLLREVIATEKEREQARVVQAATTISDFRAQITPINTPRTAQLVGLRGAMFSGNSTAEGAARAEISRMAASVKGASVKGMVGRAAVDSAVELGASAGKGFWASMGAALKGSTSASSQLISVFSNTLSSLGSGMSPAKVLMQQGPNLAQSFTLMGKSAISALQALIPFAAVASVFAVIGIALFKVYSHFQKIATALLLARERMGWFGSSVTTVASAVEKANAAFRDHASWLKTISNSYLSLNDIVSDAIGLQDELNQIELDKAKSAGATPETIKKMELGFLEKKLDYLENAKKIAGGTFEGDKARFENFSAAANSPESISRDAEITTKEKALVATTSLMDEIQTINRKNESSVMGIGRYGDNIKQKTSGGEEISFNEAKKQAETLAADLSALKNESKEFTTALDKAKEAVDKSKQDKEAADKAYNLAERAFTIASMRMSVQEAPKMTGYSLNAQQKMGAYASTPPDWNILLANVKSIAANTSELKPKNNPAVGSRRAAFGADSHK